MTASKRRYIPQRKRRAAAAMKKHQEGGGDPNNNAKLATLILPLSLIALPTTETEQQAKSVTTLTSLAAQGQAAVSFMFNLKGIIVLDNKKAPLDEDKAMEDALKLGGVDLSLRTPRNYNRSQGS